jgi:lipoate-protein ligase A
MKYIRNQSTNPYYNMAMEEYVLKGLNPEEEYFVLWQNSPAIIVGKHQNTVEEINARYVRDNDIYVVRRLSGGGAVYHDAGNINFTFIINNVHKEFLDFKRFTLPVIGALKRMGVKAELSGRNDLTIDGRKFSGNAQYMYRNRLLHHGTLLFDSELDVLQQALNVDPSKILSKGIKSVRSRVTNIREHLERDISISGFIDLLARFVFEYHGQPFEEYVFTDQDRQHIDRLMKEKYSTWDWNYGQSPPFNYRHSERFAGGKVEVLLEVRNGIIEGCKIYGDFLGVGDVAEVEQMVAGQRYTLDGIQRVLSAIDIRRYFGDISLQELVSCFFA